jgi:hypothetical protein
LLDKGVERAVITDFGLARAADDISLTRIGVIAGTPEYMSPEQAKGEAVDARSDLFSLGCVLYEMASGVSPFRTDSTMGTLRRIIDEPPRSIDSISPELPTWFTVLVNQLLEKAPEHRFASASVVRDLLSKCLGHLQQPAGVAIPKELEAARSTRLIWFRLLNEKPAIRWTRVVFAFLTLALMYCAVYLVMRLAMGIELRWMIAMGVFSWTCIGLVTSIEREKQKLLCPTSRFRFSLGALMLIILLLAVGIAFFMKDVANQLDTLRTSVETGHFFRNPHGGHVEGLRSSAFFVEREDRIQYVLYSADQFTSTSDTSGKNESGTIALTNRQAFHFQRLLRGSTLQINGVGYELREGRFFELKSDGHVIQHGFFPNAQEAKSLDELETLLRLSFGRMESTPTEIEVENSSELEWIDRAAPNTSDILRRARVLNNASQGSP